MTSARRWFIIDVAEGEAAAMMPALLVTNSRRPACVTCCGRPRSIARWTGSAGSPLESPAARSSRSPRISATSSISPAASASVWVRCANTWMIAPTPTVTRKAMIRAGTARRRAGSALSKRRYAGPAIDCANPLMESGRADALAASARAITGLLEVLLEIPTRDRRDCRISPNHDHKNRRFVICRESAGTNCWDAGRHKPWARQAKPPNRLWLAVAPMPMAVKGPSAGPSRLGERAADDVGDVARQAVMRRDPPERPLGAGAPPRLERAPALERGEQPRRHLRVLAVERDHRVGYEVVAAAVGVVELGLVRLRERPDQGAQPVRVAERERRMRREVAHALQRRGFRDLCLEREPLVDHQGIVREP